MKSTSKCFGIWKLELANILSRHLVSQKGEKTIFKRNEGTLDRILRVALGIPLLPAGLFWLGGLQSSVLGLLAAGLGVLALITGLTGVCILYIPFGISTLESEKKQSAQS